MSLNKKPYKAPEVEDLGNAAHSYLEFLACSAGQSNVCLAGAIAGGGCSNGANGGNADCSTGTCPYS